MNRPCLSWRLVCLRVILSFMNLSLPLVGHSQQVDDDEMPSGLLATYTIKQTSTNKQTNIAGQSLKRIDPDIAFVWGAAAPDERLPPGPFTAQWTGQILLRGEGKTRWHAYLQGKATVRIGDTTVLQGDADQPGWLNGGEFDFGFGEKPLLVQYERTGEAAQLKLFWSSTDFPLEPLPYHILFHEKTPPEVTLAERGRVLFESHRCANCHGEGREPEKAFARLAAPSLKHVGQGTSRAWLVDKLAGQAKQPENKMPHYGFTRDEADDVVAALLEQAQSMKLDALPKLKDAERDKDLKEGRTLIRSVGCLACHTIDNLGEAAPFGGGSLADIGQRRSADWLATWLADPKKINEQTRMPVVSLSDKERAQIVLALLDNGAGQNEGTEGTKGTNDSERATRGRKLIESARCSACHEFSKSQPLVERPRSLREGSTDWAKGCLVAVGKQNRSPEFANVDSKAIRAYVASWNRPVDLAGSGSNQALSPLRWLQQKNCLSCHDRDGTKGLSRFAASIAKSDETLSGLHMTLIPPRLNAVGDRMRDEALTEAISGAPKSPRLNWLRVRMPRFQHTETEKKELVAYLIGHDRVPELGQGLRGKGQAAEKGDAGDRGSVTQSLSPQPSALADPQSLLAGRELLGGKGFSCVACHAVKDYTPKVTALGTRGSNLHLLGQRIRPEYYYRWTRAPLRIMPGVEMPNYQRPHPTILVNADGSNSLHNQLTAIWDTLNDPNLTAPTNPAVVEQLLTINQGEPARVVRDVFTVEGSADDTVARAFAFGLDNGHSVLFDLDTGGICAWTLGDFARQRCEGKRWYWDLAGVALATGFNKQSEFLFIDNKSGEVISPENGWLYETEFDQFKTSHDGQFTYHLTVSKGDQKHSLDVHEHFRQDSSRPSLGWNRLIAIHPRSGTGNLTITPWHRGAVPKKLHSAAAITFEGIEKTRPKELPDTSRLFERHRAQAPFQFMPDHFQLSVHYSTTLKRVEVVSPNPPAPPLISSADRITSVPGFKGIRLPLPRSIMPTAMTFDDKSRLIFTSLKGHVYRVDGSGKETGDRRQETGEEKTKTKSEAVSVKLTMLTEGLAAPFGLFWQGTIPSGKYPGQPGLIVAHKPELLTLVLKDDKWVHEREVLATGWGITDDYHDWTCGIVRDSKGELYVVTGSDYAFKARPKEKSRWRGHALRIDDRGQITSIARGLRFPTGIAIDDQDRLFVTDQQGVQNTFNELNHVQPGHVYGVPSRHEENPNELADAPAIQIPHPWTRSVNGVVFVGKRNAGDRIQKTEGDKLGATPVPSPPSSGERARVRGLSGEDATQPQAAGERTPHPNPLPSKARGEGTGKPSLALDTRHSSLDSIAGHFLAVEYNNNSIIRMTTQDVDGVLQGAAYPFSRPVSNEAAPLSFDATKKPMPQDASSFIGPICIAVAPQGDIYVGSFQDGGWAGGLNMGDIVRLTPEGDLPNGIREIRATSRGFDIEFFHAVDAELARDPKHYKISGYTRVWKGDYATPDSGRHSGEVTGVSLDAAAKTASLTVTGLKPSHVYDIAVGEIGREPQRKLWPEVGYYTLHRVPK